MAIEEKLFKSLELLRITSEYSGDVCQRNKEKIQNCTYVTDTLTNPTTRTLPNFHHLLTSSFEILFQMCNDIESDVRLVAEESLNKIIKAMDNENTNKVLMELHKEIKRNGPARSLKSALWRFSILAGLIRLPKRKQYLISLIPCIVSISERSEDLTHEALMNSLPKILKSLGSFLSDSDVKTLLNTFLNNVGDSSTVIRRASANCLLTICINCRKPYQFLSYLLDTLLELLMPTAGTMVSVFLVVGVLSCLRMLIPHIRKIEGRQEIQGSFGITKKTKVIQVGEEKFVQVYRLCVHFLLCDDDSVMSAALDTLSSLFQNCTREFKNLLLSGNGIGVGDGRYYLPAQLYNANNVTRAISKPALPEESRKQNDTATFSSPPEESAAEEDVELHKKDGMNLIRVRNVKELCRNDEILDIGSPHDKEVALIFCTRLVCRLCLLSGRRFGMIPDNAVRISVKSSALASLASLFAIYPQSFLLYLSKNRSPSDEIDDRQPISDIMLLTNHSDPQLRGAIRLVIASYLKSAFLEASTAASYDDWLSSITDTSLPNEFNSNRLLAFIKEGLLDVSSNCVRQSLTGLITCMNYVLLSSDCRLVLALLEQIPVILQGAHWLVKAKILEVIEQLPFPLIHSMGAEENFRDRLVFDVVFGLLADEDQRVRTIAAKTVVRIVPLLFYSEGRKSAERVVVEHTHMYFHDGRLSKTAGKRDSMEEEEEKEGEEKEKEGMSEEEKIQVKIFCDDLPFPFDTLFDTAPEENRNVRDALSMIVSALCRRLERNFASDSTIAGYVEALSLLSSSYPTTTYKEIWGVDESCQMNLLSFVGCLLDNELIYDIDCHTYVLRLYGNLFAGMCVHMLRTKDIDDITTATPLTPTAAATATVQRLLWRKFSEKRQQEICESFLNHTLKLLNIFVHIIEDTSLTELKPPSANSNSTASSGGSSPLKTAKKVIGGDLERANSVNERKADDDEKTDKKNESTTTAKAVGMGYFANSAHYVKIYHGLRIAYLKYKATLNYDDQPDNIVTLLGVLLKSLGQILEIATIVETSRIAEELLSYLQTVFYLEPTCAISCVHQLLKSLFGSNLISRTDALKLLKQTAIDIDENATDGSLHYALSQFHYNDLSRYLEVLRCRFRTNRRSDTPPMTWLAYTHRKEKRQAPVKPDKMLANYIRLFEPMVIRSLKDYTITSNVDVQCAVLRLLNQLVRLKVNYCLLDSEQVFIKFIQKQFEYIEEGLMAHPEKIIPKMFEFLMNLSHGKQHSKSIIGVPKVIHLCDGLMASGQAPLAYCIPALRPIVENIFLLARHHDYAVAGTAVAAADHSELEITREVLMSMLLRLFEYAEVMDLLRAILEGTKRAESRQPMEKWLKYSKQMFDVFFAKLTDDKLRLDNRNDTLALMRWLIVLHPITFSLPTVGERLVTILFRKLPGKMDNFNIISRWLGKITIILTIIVQLKKDALLKAIRDSLKNFSSEGIFDGVSSVRSDPLNVTNVENDFESIDAAAIFLKFTFRALELVAGRCALAIRQDEDVPFLIEQLSHFLFVCSRIYRPEHCFATVTSLIADANSRSDDDDQSSITLEPINANFLVIGRSFPFVVYQWCCLLASLGCNPARAWIRKFMVSEAGNGDYGSSQNHHPRGRRRLPLNRLNSAVSTSSALISLSEYLIEKDERLEELSMFIEDDNLLRLAMRHCDEPPVAEVLLSVQRDPIISALFFERIRTTVQQHRLDPNVTIKLLDVLQDCHRTQTGSLIRLLIEYILKCRHLAVLRTIVNLSCRKLEYLLTFDVADIRRQISEEDLRLLTDRLVKNKLVGKNETLLGLLSKLSVHIGNGSTLEHHRQRRIDVSLVKNLEIDRTWYLKQLAASNAYVCNTSSSLNLAEVFRRINVENVANIDDQSCRKFILRSFLALVSLGTNEDDNHQTMTNEQSSLLQLAVREAFGDLVCFLKTFPRYHQVYIPENRTLYPQEETYANELDAVFRNGDNETWRRDFIELTASVENITRSFRRIDQFDEKSTLNLSLVVRFCVICAESLVYRLFNDDDDDDLNVEQVESILRRLDVILKLPELIRILALDAHWTWLCSLVNSLYILFEFLTPNSAYHNQLPKFDISDIADMKNTIVQHCYGQFETVFLNVSKEWSSMKIPRTFREAITSILINLSKIPALNSYLLTPTALWKQSRTSVMMKQDAEVDDVDHLQQPAPLPIDFLKDFQLLEEYNFRISRLGWSSRKQFEETWMSLLSVLNSGLIEENDAVPSTNSFAIKTATALLGRTLYNQSNGNDSSTIFHVSRDPPIKETDTSVKKLKSIQDKFERWLRTATANFTCNTPSNIVMNVFNKPNIEKLHPNTYSCGQISIAYLSLPSKASTEGADDDEDNDTDDILGRMYRERRATLLESNLDLNSCIQSLLDLYSQWFRSFENRPQSAKILNEILKSIVVISDLFQHRSQFQWMLDICAEYAKNPLLENDILYRYIIVGVCKATAVLNPDMEVYELVKKILYQYAKSSNVSVRISCLHGLLYLLEGCVLSNTVIGGLSDELQLVLPIAIEYIDEFQKNASAGTNKFCNQEHDLTVWALTFFIIENVHEDHLPLSFTDSAILSLLSCLRKSKQITMDVYSCLIKALERLIIKRCLAEDSRELILKLAIEKTKDGHAMQSLIAVQLMISCMYTDYTDRRRNSGNSDAYSNDNPDNLVHIVEKISIIFDRIKKGLPFQVEVLCHVLPDVINDFFSPADILTKVVGEYLSPQQKYPALLSHIVFEVFENGIAQSQIPLLQDWVVVSLSNFIQTFSAGMATWYLTCFFVSTSTNFWLRSIFPRVRTRIGRLEHEDRLMLCIAGRDFYNNLTTDKQRQIFVDAFRRAKEEGGEPDSPFSDLLECL